jgi:DNA-binding NarL/FixJ family response regulator
MKGTVLLVEDERDTRELLAQAIERDGWRCVTAGSPTEALERAKGAGFVDVTVTDVVLGGDDRAGLRLINELRAAGIHAPVIVITAYADVQKVKLALNEGAAHLLEKPFRAPQLLEAIERARSQGGDAHHAVEQVLTRANLTAKERTVALHLLDGLSSSEIAELEHNSPKTIRQHVSQIYAKCGVGSRAELFRLVYAR